MLVFCQTKLIIEEIPLGIWIILKLFYIIIYIYFIPSNTYEVLINVN